MYLNNTNCTKESISKCISITQIEQQQQQKKMCAVF